MRELEVYDFTLSVSFVSSSVFMKSSMLNASGVIWCLQLRGVMDPKRHYKASDMKGIPKYFQVRFSDLIMATITNQDFFFHKLCGACVHGNHHSCLVFATPADWNSSGRRCRFLLRKVDKEGTQGDICR